MWIAPVGGASRYRVDKANQPEVIFVKAPQTLARHTVQNMAMIEEAERLFKPRPKSEAISEYERDQQRIRANLERLKKERLARENAESGKL